MAQNIKKLIKESLTNTIKMPEGHEARFLEKLNTNTTVKQTLVIKWQNIAAVLLVALGLSYGGFTFFKTSLVQQADPIQPEPIVLTKTLGDVSPSLKKVEEYYLASINLELSKLKYTAETKVLFDSYLQRLNELNQEYNNLNKELNTSGPNELTINALIDNLKLRLNLLYRLKDQLNILNNPQKEIIQTSI